MVGIKLEVSAGCPSSAAAIALLDLVGVEFEILYTTQVTGQLLPRLTIEERTVCGFGAITRHGLKSNPLYKGTAEELAAVDQWLDIVYSDVHPLVEATMQPNSAAAADNLASYLADIQRGLTKGKFLASSELTAADLALLFTVLPAVRLLLGSTRVGQLATLTAYLRNLAQLPLLQRLVGKLEFAAEPLTIAAPKPVIAAKAAAAPKKAEPKPDDEEPREVKKEYVFPETSFNFYDFKTKYVNAPSKREALEYLLQNWDANAFSFWYLTYDKLPTECKKLFLTSNLMNGFISRAEACRKYVLGVHAVYGEEPDLEIRGVWLWRGPEMLEPLKEHQQFDVYKYRKLDPANAEDKALIEEYWTKTAEDTTLEGQTLQVLKYFK